MPKGCGSPRGGDVLVHRAGTAPEGLGNVLDPPCFVNQHYGKGN